VVGLQVTATLAARDFDVDLTVADGEVLAVLGPNGAGKSTLLDIVAGLVRPDLGHVLLGDRMLTDTTKSIAVPPYRRSIGLLAQQPLLFPNLSVAANVAFGPRSRGVARRRAHQSARHWLAAVDAFDLADRRPAQLSGGQAQRVAVARALAAEPDVLLLDEPFAALDASSAPALRTLLRQVLSDHGRTAVLVTHDIIDALTLADRVIVLDGGVIVEQGKVGDVLARPRSDFAAAIAGMNLLVGTATAEGLQAVGSPEVALSISGLLESGCVPGFPAAAVFSPAAVAIYRDKPGGSPRNVFRVRVVDVEARGGVVRVYADTAGLRADVTVTSAVELSLAAGDDIYLVVKATEVAVYPRGTPHR